MIYIAGQPHVLIGGANSEALDNAAVLARGGIPVTLVPYAGPSRALVERAIALGMQVQPYFPGIFHDKIVAGWNHLPYLLSLASGEQPRCAIYFNCMTQTSKAERYLHSDGHIDVFGFVSRYQRNIICTELGRINRVKEFEGYMPPITTDFRPFGTAKIRNTGAIGCLMRDDPTKVNLDVLKIVSKTSAQKLIWMGYGSKCTSQYGIPALRTDLAFEGGNENFIPVSEFFDSIDLCLHLAGPIGESFCRIMLESMISGVPFLCERNYAFPEYMTGSVESQMCETISQFVERANMILANPDHRASIARSQYKHLEDLDLNGRCLAAWRKLIARHS